MSDIGHLVSYMPSSENAAVSVVAAVLEEISILNSSRPGLVAAALAMAAVLDNPRATSSKPPGRGTAGEHSESATQERIGR